MIIVACISRCYFIFFTLTIGIGLVACSVVFADDFTDTIQAARQDETDPDHSEWVGEFWSWKSPDYGIQCFLSSSKGMLGYRIKDVFGFRTGKAIKISFREGEVQIEDGDKTINGIAIDLKMLVVKHGQRVYLVPNGNLHGFCLQIKEQHIPERFLHKGKNTSEHEELKVPEKYQIYTDLPEITATILEMRNSVDDVTELVIDKGKNDHVYVEMLFEDDDYYQFQVVEIEEAKSVLRLDFPSNAYKLKIGGLVRTAR